MSSTENAAVHSWERLSDPIESEQDPANNFRLVRRFVGDTRDMLRLFDILGSQKRVTCIDLLIASVL